MQTHHGTVCGDPDEQLKTGDNYKWITIGVFCGGKGVFSSHNKAFVIIFNHNTDIQARTQPFEVMYLCVPLMNQLKIVITVNHLGLVERAYVEQSVKTHEKTMPCGR